MADDGYVTLSDDNFEEEVLRSPLPVLVDFWAPWCGPCIAMAPVIEELAADFAGRAKVAKLNVDENSYVAAALGLRSIPTLLIFKGGKIVDQVVGLVQKRALSEKLSAAGADPQKR